MPGSNPSFVVDCCSWYISSKSLSIHGTKLSTLCIHISFRNFNRSQSWAKSISYWHWSSLILYIQGVEELESDLSVLKRYICAYDDHLVIVLFSQQMHMLIVRVPFYREQSKLQQKLKLIKQEYESSQVSIISSNGYVLCLDFPMHLCYLVIHCIALITGYISPNRKVMCHRFAKWGLTMKQRWLRLCIQD